jgi:hypothetical protein
VPTPALARFCRRGGWFTEDPEVVVDRDEITVVGRLQEPRGAQGEGADGRAARFRVETRPERTRIADEAQARNGARSVREFASAVNGSCSPTWQFE